MNHLLGAHTSIAGGVSTAIDRAKKFNYTAIQIFTKNNSQWAAKPLEEEEIKSFRSKLAESNIKVVVAHDSYLINLCAADKALLKKSREAFIDELNRCEQLGIHHLNFHPGAHMGKGEVEGLKIIAESINKAHLKTPRFQVSSMIELTAGQGTSLGCKFEQLQKVIEMIEEKERMTVCIDTAHIFAAGYNIKNLQEYKKIMKEFDSSIGLFRLQCIHVNDSKTELGSRIDRHEHIGKGFIGLEGFRNIMNDKKLMLVPKILETPKGKEQLEDLENLAKLKSLVKSKKSV